MAVNKKTVFQELLHSRKTEAIISSAVPLSLLKGKPLSRSVSCETNRSPVTEGSVTAYLKNFLPGCLEVSYTVLSVMPRTTRHLSELKINSLFLVTAFIFYVCNCKSFWFVCKLCYLLMLEPFNRYVLYYLLISDLYLFC